MADSSEQCQPVDPNLDIHKLWEEVNRVLRSGPVMRSLWDAVAKAVPVALAGNTLILGMPTQDVRYSGYIQTAVNHAKLVDIIYGLSGQRLQLRVIDGTTPEAWARTQELDRIATEHAAGIRTAQHSRKDAARSWEGLNRELLLAFSGTTLRRYPTQLAAMLLESLALVHEAERTVRANDPDNAAHHDRELNRVFDRLSTYCDLPATAIALEYLRYQASLEAGGEESGA